MNLIINSSENCQQQTHTISNSFISDNDFIEILSLIEKHKCVLTIKNCDIELKHIKRKQLKTFLQTIEIKNSRLYLSKQLIEMPKLMVLLDKSNVVTCSSFLDSLLTKNCNSIEDLNALDMKKICLCDESLKDVKLPKDNNFFQLIKEKKVSNTKLPSIDFTKYNIEDVSFCNCTFSEGTIFPQDFFQKIKNKTLIGCSLPPIDFESWEIEDCTFQFVKFHKDSTFPEDKDFFQKFNILYGCTLPERDYRKYNFEHVNLKYCSFLGNSAIPYSKHLTETMIENNYPKSFTQTVHIMPIENISFDEIMFKYGKYLTPNQIATIHNKTLDPNDKS